MIGYGGSPYLLEKVLTEVGAVESSVEGIRVVDTPSSFWMFPSISALVGAPSVTVYQEILERIIDGRKVFANCPSLLAGVMRQKFSKTLSAKVMSSEVFSRYNAHDKAVEWAESDEVGQQGMEWVADSGFTEEEAVRAYWYVEHGGITEFVHLEEGYRAWVTRYPDDTPALLVADVPYDLRRSPATYAGLASRIAHTFGTEAVVMGSAGTSQGSFSTRQKALCLSGFLSYFAIQRP